MSEMPPFRYLSFGAGVQSSALLACSTFGLYGVQRADVAIFADTQQEPAWVYAQVEALRAKTDIRIDTVTAGDLGADSIGGSFMRLPTFTVNATTGKKGIIRRQCTREYKIAPIQRHVRALLGYQPRQRVRRKVIALVGISLDEITRQSPSKEQWIERRHPLIDANLTRNDCVKILQEVGWPIPKKSACIFCPFHDDAYWADLKDHHPEEWAKAVAFDAAVRNSTKAGLRQPVFLHNQRIPLSEVVLKPCEAKNPLIQTRLGWDSFSEECSGSCGV
jgi:hypothetical protein